MAQNAAKKPRKLSVLTVELLGMQMWSWGHSSVEDALATVLLYNLASTAGK